MATVIQNVETTPPRSPRKGSDSHLQNRLSERLEMLKHPNDLVRITQVSPAHFRVNTLSPVVAENSLLSTYRIAKSQFLHVADQDGELVITDQTRR